MTLTPESTPTDSLGFLLTNLREEYFVKPLLGNPNYWGIKSKNGNHFATLNLSDREAIVDSLDFLLAKANQYSSIYDNDWLSHAFNGKILEFFNSCVPNDFLNLSTSIDNLTHAIKNDEFNNISRKRVISLTMGDNSIFTLSSENSYPNYETPYVFAISDDSLVGQDSYDRIAFPIVRYLDLKDQVCRVCGVQSIKVLEKTKGKSDEEYETYKTAVKKIIEKDQRLEILIENPNNEIKNTLFETDRDLVERYAAKKYVRDEWLLREKNASKFVDEIKEGKRFDRNISPYHLASLAIFIATEYQLSSDPKNRKIYFDFPLDLFMQYHTFKDTDAEKETERINEQLIKLATEISAQIPKSVLEPHGDCIRLVLGDELSFINAGLERIRKAIVL